MRYIRICRDVIDPSNKRKFNGGGYLGSHGGHWERSKETVPETRRDRIMGTAQYLVAEEMFTLVRDRTDITAEAEVREGVMVKTPTPPTSTDR